MIYLVSILFGLYATALETSMAGMEILGWALFACFLVRFIQDGRPWRKLRSGAEIPFALFALSVVVGASLVEAPMHDRIDMVGTLRWMLLFYAFFYLLQNYVRPKWEKAHLYWLGLVVLMSVYAFAQYQWGFMLLPKAEGLTPYGDHFRAMGFFNLCITFAYVIGIAGLSALALALEAWAAGKNRQALLAGLAYLAVWVAVYSTVTRGAWISYAVGSMVAVLVFAPRKGLWVGFATAIVVAALYVFVTPVHERVSSIFDKKNESNAERMVVWRANLEIFKDHPVFGVGMNQNADYLFEYYKKLGIDSTFKSHAHNNVIQFLSTLGLVGTLGFLGFSLWFIWMAWRLFYLAPASSFWFKSIGLGSLAAQIHVQVGGMTEVNFRGQTQHNLLFVWALTLACLRMVEARKKA